jgi:hypothetical protein
MWIGLPTREPERDRRRFLGGIESASTLNLILFLTCAVLLGCNDLGSGPSADDEIIQKAYSHYSLPQWFSTEDFNSVSPYYENTISIYPLAERGTSWFELSTNDYNQALAWSEASSRNSAYYRDLVSQRETEKFYEFTRVYAAHPNDAILSRVHKSSYLDRSEFDKLHKGSVLGRFQVRPVTMKNVKELIEYLWCVDNNYDVGTGVLSTSMSENTMYVDYLLQEYDLVYGDWGMHDNIIISDAVFRVEKASGLIAYSRHMVRTIEGRQR